MNFATLLRSFFHPIGIHHTDALLLKPVNTWLTVTGTRDSFRNSKFDDFGKQDEDIYDREHWCYNPYEESSLTKEELLLLFEAKELVKKDERNMFGNTDCPASVAERLLCRVTADCNLVRATFWNGVYHRISNDDVKQIAHFQANYWTQNFGTAMSLLNSNMNHYSKISKKKRAKLLFPTDDEGLQALKTAVSVKSLDHDVEKETDSTLQKVVVVKPRDIHSRR